VLRLSAATGAGVREALRALAAEIEARRAPREERAAWRP
jgi:hypothetical protein